MTIQFIRTSLIFILLGGVSAYAQSPKLIGHWRFEKMIEKGKAVPGHSGGPNGSVKGQLTLVEGRHGKAAKFDGKNYIVLGNLGSHEQATVMFWFNFHTTSKSKWRGLVSSLDWKKGVFHFPLRDRKIDIYFHLGGSNRGRVQSKTLKKKAWYHTALVMNCKSGVMTLYVDGKKTSTDAIKPCKQIHLNKICVAYEGKARYFMGLIDEVRIFSAALSEKQIKKYSKQ